MYWRIDPFFDFLFLQTFNNNKIEKRLEKIGDYTLIWLLILTSLHIEQKGFNNIHNPVCFALSNIFN